MKLASYIAEGQACFGVVIGDGVLTLNRRLGNRYATLRDALAADALAEIRKAADATRRLTTNCPAPGRDGVFACLIARFAKRTPFKLNPLAGRAKVRD